VKLAQKIQQTLSVESLNPPDTLALAAHFSLGLGDFFESTAF
jgi:hypothetical protein